MHSYYRKRSLVPKSQLKTNKTGFLSSLFHIDWLLMLPHLKRNFQVFTAGLQKHPCTLPKSKHAVYCVNICKRKASKGNNTEDQCGLCKDCLQKCTSQMKRLQDEMGRLEFIVNSKVVEAEGKQVQDRGTQDSRYLQTSYKPTATEDGVEKRSQAQNGLLKSSGGQQTEFEHVSKSSSLGEPNIFTPDHMYKEQRKKQKSKSGVQHTSTKISDHNEYDEKKSGLHIEEKEISAISYKHGEKSYSKLQESGDAKADSFLKSLEKNHDKNKDHLIPQPEKDHSKQAHRGYKNDSHFCTPNGVCLHNHISLGGKHSRDKEQIARVIAELHSQKNELEKLKEAVYGKKDDYRKKQEIDKSVTTAEQQTLVELTGSCVADCLL